MMSLALSTNKPASESTENIKKFDDKDPFYFEGKTTHFEGKKRGDKQSIITLIEASGITRLRKMLWTKAYSVRVKFHFSKYQFFTGGSVRTDRGPRRD
jgi:hypothetical protein